MSTIFEQEISGNERDYRVEFSIDEPENDESDARFEIRGGTRRTGTETWQEIILHGEVDLAKELITVSYEDREPNRIDMDLAPDARPDQASGVVDNDDAVELALAGHIEAIIQGIPVDPLLGCLIKSAASVSIGQIIRCWLAHQRTRSVRQIVICLRNHISRMLLKFAFKAGKCAVTFGWL